jgi:hypothetical protein
MAADSQSAADAPSTHSTLNGETPRNEKIVNFYDFLCPRYFFIFSVRDRPSADETAPPARRCTRSDKPCHDPT